MQVSKGIRTRALLVAAMALVIATVTLSSLLLVRHRLRDQVTTNFSRDLAHSVRTFQDLQGQRLQALDRESALIADEPRLKALMTTYDAATIQNEAGEFWKLSGNDLFALADMRGRVVAAYMKGPQGGADLSDELHAIVASPEILYLISGTRLFACSVRPLYFGSASSGSLLGYVISGFSIDHSAVEEMSRATMVNATFVSRGHILASTLASPLQASGVFGGSASRHAAVSMDVGGEKYLALTVDLTANASAPLQLIVLKSLDEADRSIRQIDHLVLIAGLLAMVLGTVLMFALSHAVTQPLEELAAGVRAFGLGDSTHLLPLRGTREVLQLSSSFSRMRLEIQQSHRALLESERLATIGRMASSVSHDLRHYLAAVYANAEFLALAQLSEAERTEILSDIRNAVYGTTELIDSMLIFSRTGKAIRRSPEMMATLLERAVALVRKHPDAGIVSFSVQCGRPAETLVVVEAKQIERAIYNVLLNACQATRAPGEAPRLTATIKVEQTQIALDVTDNGTGVPQEIRNSLFEPFVSQGKQKGSGLGLTLAHCIAAEHGGYLALVSTRPGETIFRMSVARGSARDGAAVTETAGAEVRGEATLF